ncbi:glycosyltransferase family 22 protein [Amanita rubescens]|nr:glycosyltransferase family 22 protein [Amanita rubescens]
MPSSLASVALDLFVLVVAWLHVLLAPYTKVEESFNLHATHDVLMHGVLPSALPNYDHFIFPGAVPRTFVGSVLLAWISTPVIMWWNKMGLVSTKFDLQIAIRLTLATLNASGLCYLRRAVSRRFSHRAGVLFVLLTCSQFHLPFWMGRTLPNMFALLPVNIAISHVIGHNPVSIRQAKRSYKSAIGLLTFTAVVFRAEIALLLAPLVLQLLLTRKLTILEVIKVGLYSGLASIALTVYTDSYFWKAFPLWPELYGLYFNIYQGKSADWGVSPPLTYVKNYLPKLLLGSLPLSLFGAVIDSRIRSLLFPAVSFIALISCLGHKEWRFIIYVVPIFNIAAAHGASYLCARKPPVLRRISILITTSIITANVLVTIIFTLSSLWNYPGGEAMTVFHQKYPPSHKPTPHIHISNLAAQTGASLFLHLNSPPYPPSYLMSQQTSSKFPTWTYNKTEHLSEHVITSSHQITHDIVEHAPRGVVGKAFRPIANILAYDRWAIDKDVLVTLQNNLHREFWDVANVVRMVKTPKLWILERVDRGGMQLY